MNGNDPLGMISSAGPALCDSEDPGNFGAAPESLAVWHDPDHGHSLNDVLITRTINCASLDESLCRNVNTRAVARLIGHVDGKLTGS